MFSKYVLFKKRHLNKRAGVWTPWTPPGSATAWVRLAAEYSEDVCEATHKDAFTTHTNVYRPTVRWLAAETHDRYLSFYCMYLIKCYNSTCYAVDCLYASAIDGTGGIGIRPLYVVWTKGSLSHTRLPSVRFRSWSQFLAVSMQVTWVINPAV